MGRLYIGSTSRSFHVKRQNPTVLGQVGDGTRLAHIYRVPRYRQPGRDDVAKTDHLGDLAVELDPQHTIEMPVADKEPAMKRFERILRSARDEKRKRNGRRILRVELTDVRHDGETVRAVPSIDADNVAAADVGADKCNQCVRGLADERDVNHPTEGEPDHSFRETA